MLRRLKWSVIIMMIFILGSPATVWADDEITVIQNGSTVETSIKPFILEDRVYMPLRTMVESLGGQVLWKGSHEPIAISLNKNTIQMLLNDNEYILNGETRTTENVPKLKEDVTYLPLRLVGESLGFLVNWDASNRSVVIQSSTQDQPENELYDDIVWSAETLTILGNETITLEEMERWFQENIIGYESLPSLYYSLGKKYGIRPDLAIAQALKETAYLRYGGLVLPEQNNLCGLYATGIPLTGTESLYEADAARVFLTPGLHGASFLDLITGVEAHLQHLYAYATDAPLPEGASIVDPRFNLLAEHLVHLRGSAPVYAYLGAYNNPNKVGWASPGVDYGHEIVALFLRISSDIQQMNYSYE